jgi:hypothetical protein
MLKKFFFAIVIVCFGFSLALANGGDSSWFSDNTWFMSGKGGIVLRDVKAEGVARIGFGRIIFKNICLYGNLEEINIDEQNLENWSGKILWYTASPKILDKSVFYLLTGGGLMYNPAGTDNGSLGVGFGFVFPTLKFLGLDNARPLLEVEGQLSGNEWFIMPTVGIQVDF